MANSELSSVTKVSVSTGKWFAGWFGAFGVLYMMAEIPSMADLAATFAIGIVLGTAVFTTPATSTANGTSGPVQGPFLGMTPAQIQAANNAARARIGG